MCWGGGGGDREDQGDESMKNEEVLHLDQVERSIVHTGKRKMAYWVGHI
jgi:hypothetical protein